MSFEITGIVKQVGETQEVTDTFKKREVVISHVSGQYEKDVAIEFMQDRVEKLDGINPGDEVKIGFDVESRAWKDRFFTSCKGWRIEVLSAAGSPVEDDEIDMGDDLSDSVPF